MIQKHILFTIINLSACVHISYMQEPQINQDAEPFVDEFIRIAENKGFTFSKNDVVVHLGEVEQLNDDDEITIGVCYNYPWLKPYVMLDEEEWNRSSDLDKEALLFHELGHCFLGRDHREEVIDLNPGYMPVSIMNHIAPRHLTYRLHREYYISELFDLSQVPMETIITHYRPTTNYACLYLNSCGQ